ncbi:MAG: HAD family hydrolase [Candidatus Hydrogenedentes bacterium]|nr:HAD family hydrolase [Candidatus Hydrogenedentota bacterium]
MQPKPLILLDFDGVIADSLTAYFEVFRAVCLEEGVHKAIVLEDFLRIFEQNAIQGLIDAGVPLLKLRRLGKALGPRVAQVNRQVRPFAGMPQLVAELAPRYPVYVVTSNLAEPVTAFLARHEFAGILGVLGSETDASKVKKIRRLSKRHPHNRPWYIGDTKGDMLEARKAGAVSVAAAWGWHSEALLLSAEPDHLVHSPDKSRAPADGVITLTHTCCCPNLGSGNNRQPVI